MSLASIIGKHNVNLEALKRIRRRVFVVGRFNNANDASGDPTTYLLTGREPYADYSKHFARVGPLSYDSFVKLVQPKIAEEVDKAGLIPQVRQKIPSGQVAKEESLSVLDPYNYFFLRAVATTDQEAFKKEKPDLENYLNSDPGQSIFKQIRSSLATFCEFQPKHPELVDALAKLFNGCQGGEAIPRSYAEGKPFPVGLPERLIDYLYAEDTSLPFDLEGIDFSSATWKHLQTNTAARDDLVNIIGAFRACMLTGNADQYGGKYVGQKSLRSLAESRHCGEALRKDFDVARDAYNKLRQILRNRVLLSMVLEWVVSSIYQKSEVQNLGDDYSKDVLVQKAVREGKLGLAAPVVRPDQEQQEAISQLLAANLKELVGAVVSGDISGLPETMRGVAGEILKKEGMAKALHIVAGGPGPGPGAPSAEDYQAFLDAAQVLLKDVVCATLFQKPILSLAHLYMYASAELKTAYIAAEFLQPQSEVDIRRMAQRHLKQFQKKLEEESLLTQDDSFIPELLQDFLQILANPSIAAQVESNMRVIDRVLPLLLGKSSESRPSEVVGLEGGVTGQRTRPDVSHHLDNMIEEIVEDMSKQVAANSAAYSEPAAVGTGIEAPLAVPATAAAVTAADPPALAEPAAGKDEQGADGNGFEGILTKIIMDSMDGEEFPAGGREDSNQEVVRRVKENAAAQLEQVKSVLEDDVKIFRQLLKKVYETYKQQGEDKGEFRNRVERLTLINMLLANQKELNIGNIQSNLYQMLIDMIMTLDAQRPDPATFLKDNSLTKYFESRVFEDDEGDGMATLRNTLRIQAEESLSNVVKFVSELRGVKYLLDHLGKGSDAEIVIVNASAGEFISWLRKHNLNVVQHGKPHLVRADLVGKAANDTTLPGLVVMTELAFDDQKGKESFIADLTSFEPVQGNFRVVVPPICISIDAWDAERQWYENGKELAGRADRAASPVVIVGPAAYMNSHDDHLFPTALSASYLLAAHFLKHASQQIVIGDVPETSDGRLAVIGGQATGITPKLDAVFWPAPGVTYSLAADYYLYLILVVEASIISNNGQLSAEEFFDCFRAEMGNSAYNDSNILDDALIGGAFQFSLANQLATPGAELTAVRLFPGNNSLNMIQEGEESVLTNVMWFNQARRRLNLP